MNVRAMSVLLVPLAAAMAMDSTTKPSARPATGDTIRLWTEKAPRAKADKDADIPTLTAFFPDRDKANGCSVIVCPGGGYSGLSMEKEGTDVARWFNEHGITAFVLKYRVDPYGQPAPLLDGQRAVRLVRFNAKSWGIDEKRIGIMGFSAGGHVASSVGTHWDKFVPGSEDPVQLQSCRPDFMVLVYPVITMKDKIAHAGSKLILLGDKPPQKLVALYSNEDQVKDDTPQTFIVASKPDDIVPVKNSELFADALKYHKVPYEYLELPTGGHGYGLAKNDPKIGIWTERCLAWMVKQALINKP